MTSCDNFKPGEEGIFLNLSSELYHSSPGVSRSQLGQLDPPARLIAYLKRPEVREPWAVIGRAIHQRLLEPGKPLPFITKPETYTNEKNEVKPWSGNAKVCRKWIAEMESSGLFVLGPKEVEVIEGAVHSMTSNPDSEMQDLIASHFRKGHAEVSCFRTCQVGDTELLLKARIDWLADGLNVIDDLKSVADGLTALPSVEKLVEQYAVQAVHYLTVFNSLAMDDRRDGFVLWLIEKCEPYLVRPVKIAADSEAMRYGQKEWEKRLAVYAECIRNGRFPGWPATIIDGKLPAYTVRKMEQGEQ